MFVGFIFYQFEFEKPSIWISFYAATVKIVWGVFPSVFITGIVVNIGGEFDLLFARKLYIYNDFCRYHQRHFLLAHLSSVRSLNFWRISSQFNCPVHHLWFSAYIELCNWHSNCNVFVFPVEISIKIFTWFCSAFSSLKQWLHRFSCHISYHFCSICLLKRHFIYCKSSFSQMTPERETNRKWLMVEMRKWAID